MTKNKRRSCRVKMFGGGGHGRRCSTLATGTRPRVADRRCRRGIAIDRPRAAQPAQGADRTRARQPAQSAQAVFRRRADELVGLDPRARHHPADRGARRAARDNFEIIAGERRWRAAQRANLHEVPIVVLDVTDGEALELAIIENVQRSRSQSAGRGERLSVARQRVQSFAGRHRQDRRQEPQPCRQHAAAAEAPRDA